MKMTKNSEKRIYCKSKINRVMITHCIMENKLLKSLNSDQKQAVLATEGPNLILAGAGSGKTRVLTYKVAYLILEKEIKPENILMVTFTNKAADEMKNRISSMLKKEKGVKSVNLPSTCTFHSLCAKILRREGDHIGLSANYIIYDDQDSKDAIKQAMAGLDIDIKSINPSAVAATISQAKNELITATEYMQYARGFFQEEVARIFPVYQQILRDNSAVDFDDLLGLTVRLFQKEKEVAAKYQDRFHYILVDEYQDTNHAQYTLTKILAKKWRNLTVVGDASQSIYAWRGADFRNIINFKKDYPEAQIFHLEQNYRSTQTILNASYSIISKNQTHPILKLWTEKKSGQPVYIYGAENEHDEARFIIDQTSNFKYSDIAILYRTNAQSRVIEEALLHSGIPYTLVGGVRFYERKEIKDIISYLRLLVSPTDSVSIKRITKLGKRRMEKFLSFTDNYHSKKNKKEIPTLKIMDEMIKATGYLDRFNPKKEDDFSRLENIKELRSVASEFSNLTGFLENIALVEQKYFPDQLEHFAQQKDIVTLMTMHAAKGLEFNTIFMVGMEEGLFPHSMSLLDPQELEEERRLCYVGMTRAKTSLFLSFAKRRLYFGQRTKNLISRFVTELPEHLIAFTTDHGV